MMQLPGKVGKFDVVAMLCAPRIQLARWSIATTPARIAIEAPARVQAGAVLRATIVGQLNDAYRIEIGQPDGFTKLSRNLQDGEREEVEVKLGYNDGDYEIKVVTHDRVVLASTTVALDPAQLAINGPDRVAVGGSAAFSWPDRKENFRLELWTLAEGGKPARLVTKLRGSGRVLAAPGAYELRLLPWRSDDDRVLGRKPIAVEGKVFEQVPDGALPASTVAVRLAFKPDFFDSLIFVARGGEATRDGQSQSRNGRSLHDRRYTQDARFLRPRLHDGRGRRSGRSRARTDRGTRAIVPTRRERTSR